MDKVKGEPKFQSSYIPLNIAASIKEHEMGVQEGESCRIDALKDRFAWMRGHMNGWYGWANDGKSFCLDFLNVVKAKTDGWKFAIYKPEDMNIIMENGKPKMSANRIYKNLAWTLTGKTWSKKYAARCFTTPMTMDEELDALAWVEEHFFVIYPSDRRYTNLMDDFQFLKETKGVDVFQIDPWNVVKVPDNGERGDEKLVSAFVDLKEFTIKNNAVMNIVSHPKSMTDVHVTKDTKSPFKVVNQFMIIGGSPWDMKMDGQFSVYRPERHLDPSDKKVHLWNLKQKEAEIVGVNRGVTEGIEFSPTERQYYFDGINPLTGRKKGDKIRDAAPTTRAFDEPEYPKNDNPFSTLDEDPDKSPF